LTKREVKQFEKEARVLQRVREGLKPAEVARRLKVGVDVVYKLLAQVKRSAKRQTSKLVK
jgi:DNA-binding CsgD family transcriptional regulator